MVVGLLRVSTGLLGTTADNISLALLDRFERDVLPGSKEHHNKSEAEEKCKNPFDDAVGAGRTTGIDCSRARDHFKGFLRRQHVYRRAMDGEHLEEVEPSRVQLHVDGYGRAPGAEFERLSFSGSESGSEARTVIYTPQPVRSTRGESESSEPAADAGQTSLLEIRLRNTEAELELEAEAFLRPTPYDDDEDDAVRLALMEQGRLHRMAKDLFKSNRRAGVRIAQLERAYKLASDNFMAWFAQGTRLLNHQRSLMNENQRINAQADSLQTEKNKLAAHNSKLAAEIQGLLGFLTLARKNWFEYRSRAEKAEGDLTECMKDYKNCQEELRRQCHKNNVLVLQMTRCDGSVIEGWELVKRERAVAEREEKLVERVVEIMEREEKVTEKEGELAARERAVHNRHRTLSAKFKNLKALWAKIKRRQAWFEREPERALVERYAERRERESGPRDRRRQRQLSPRDRRSSTTPSSSSESLPSVAPSDGPTSDEGGPEA